MILAKIYPEIKNLELKTLKNSLIPKVKGNKYTYLVIGNRELIDMEVLKKIGEFKRLSLRRNFRILK